MVLGYCEGLGPVLHPTQSLKLFLFGEEPHQKFPGLGIPVRFPGPGAVVAAGARRQAQKAEQVLGRVVLLQRRDDRYLDFRRFSSAGAARGFRPRIRGSGPAGRAHGTGAPSSRAGEVADS